SGTGYYIDRWREAGAERIVGADIAPAAVERLRERYPEQSFTELDIGGPADELPEGSFDAVSAMDVLFHITDDERYGKALANLSALLRPDGVLVLTENFPGAKGPRARHQVSRPLEQFEAAAAAAGLRIEERRPMFALM